MQVPTMCFSPLSIPALLYTVNVVRDNKTLNKNSGAICAQFTAQCTTKDDEKKRGGGWKSVALQREKCALETIKEEETDEITCTTRRLFISSEIGMYIQNMVMEYARTHDTFARVE